MSGALRLVAWWLALAAVVYALAWLGPGWLVAFDVTVLSVGVGVVVASVWLTLRQLGRGQ